jgi:hypothetical protein
VLLFSALALGGCGGPQVAPSPGNPAFYVVNQGSAPIHNIYVTSVNVSGWGGDVLGDSVLQPGQRHRVNPPRGECVFDVRVVWKGGRAEERRRQDLCRVTEIAFAGPGSGAPTTQGSSNPDFFVVNNSQKTIQHIFVSTVQADKWGEDRMPGVLKPGDRFAVRLPREGQCQYDVRVVYADRTTEERRGQDLCKVSEMPFNGSGARAPQASTGSVR